MDLKQLKVVELNSGELVNVVGGGWLQNSLGMGLLLNL
jgi:hypothetical protein